MNGKDGFGKQNKQNVGHCNESATLRKLSDVSSLLKQILSLATSKSVIQQTESVAKVSNINHEQKLQDIHTSPEPNKEVINHPIFSQDKFRL